MGPEEESEILNNLMKKGTGRSFNRADRRKKPPTDNWFTKKTHKIMKIRKKNEPTKQQRKRAIATARKTRKESHTQFSQE